MAIKDIFGQVAAPRRLLLCIGPSCDQDGQAKILLDAVQKRLEAAQHNIDIVGTASCVKRACLGKCIGEPVVCVHPDEVWYHNLSVETVMRVLREHVLDLRPIPEFILEDDD
jgi:(2Fe-2S) ferredoxin